MSAIRDILASEPTESDALPPPSAPTQASGPSMPPSPAPASKSERKEAAPADTPSKSTAQTNGDAGEPASIAATPSSTKKATSTGSSVYSGSRMRHLKKEDGIPLWRKDIQYDFLRLIFFDRTECFTKQSDGSVNNTFADIYIDAMAKSSKCSKILKEKLLSDRDGAICMAMVCLLVNIGRMNTTLNFFPEMRAQLRTYHAIPALQAHQDPTAYKQLQDAPRLKSILKGATEDVPQPGTLEDVMAADKPRTNPVNLVFLLVQYALKVSEIHFQLPRDFFDLVMRPSLSSSSRARAFMWLMWWYLESDFTYEASLNNPFGPGQYPDGDTAKTGVPLMVPSLESLTEEQAAAENVDTAEELRFGDSKQKERALILASEPSTAMTTVKRSKKERAAAQIEAQARGYANEEEMRASREYNSDSLPWRRAVMPKTIASMYETGSDYTRSPSPTSGRVHQSTGKAGGDMRIDNLLNDDDDITELSPSRPAPASAPKKGPGRGNWRRGRGKPEGPGQRTHGERSPPVRLILRTKQLSLVTEGAATSGSGLQHLVSSPRNSISHDHIPTPSYQAQKRHRGVTQHQSALNNHRRLQIDYTLDQRIREIHHHACEVRESEGSMLRAWKRIRTMPPDYDSEEEEATKTSRSKGSSGKDRGVDREDDGSNSKHRGGKENIADGASDDLPGVNASDPRWSSGPTNIVIAGFARTPNEPSDVGEEAKTLARAFRRASRRLDRWAEADSPGEALIKRREARERGETSPEATRARIQARAPPPQPQTQRKRALPPATSAERGSSRGRGRGGRGGGIERGGRGGSKKKGSGKGRGGKASSASAAAANQSTPTPQTIVIKKNRKPKLEEDVERNPDEELDSEGPYAGDRVSQAHSSDDWDTPWDAAVDESDFGAGADSDVEM